MKKGSAVQSFGDLINTVKRPLEAVHSTWRTGLMPGKKFSVLHKENKSLAETLRCDIANDRLDGESLHEPVELFYRHRPKVIT